MQNGHTYNGMPDYFSHSICARIVLDRCKSEVRQQISNRPAYLLGAQGGDVFFAYKLSLKENNLGRLLHRLEPAEIFENLKKGNFSYCAGFATHYALDAILHPAVYAFEKSSKSPLSHVKFEGDLGLYISRKYCIHRSILPNECVVAQSYTVYDSMVKLIPQITLTGVERCLKRHFLWTRTLIKNKRTSYTFKYDYSSLSGAVEDAISLGVECVEGLSSGKSCKELFTLSFLEK